MQNPFEKIMKEKSDSDLIMIIRIRKNDYQALAIEAAEKEIAFRGIKDFEIKAIESELGRNYSANWINSEMPLNSLQKTLFVFFCWGLVPWIISFIYLANGYHQKFRDAWRFMTYGMIGIFALYIIFWIIDTAFGFNI